MAVEGTVAPAVESMQRCLKKQFDINVSVPELMLPRITMDIDLAKCGTVSAKTTTSSYHERRWYSLWLWKHEETYHTTKYSIDPEKVQEDIVRVIEERVDAAGKLVHAYLDGELRKSIDSFFGDIHGVFDNIRGAVVDARRIRNESREKQEAAKVALTAICADVDRLVKRAEEQRRRTENDDWPDR